MVTPLGNTALHLAACVTDYKLAELLLSLKPCIILMRNVNQETALHKAAAAGCLEVVKVLLNFKSNEVRCNSPECAHPDGYDLEGGRLDLMDLWRAQNVDNETALHYAARGDYVDIVSLLFEKVEGIELILNNTGKSALYTTCQSGSWSAIKKLGEIDIISDTRKDKQTCLHQLLTIGGPHDSGMALYLLKKRPTLAEKADTSDNVPLHLASIRDNLEIVEELLRICPDMALRKNKDGMAAIHYAALIGSPKTMSCLIDSVPDCIEVLGKDNKNAFHFALEHGNTRATNTLLLKSMDPSFLVNHADKDGQTAIHKAAVNSEMALVMLPQLLKKSRWNANEADKNDLVQAKIRTMMKLTYGKQLRKRGTHRKARITLKRHRNRPLLEGSPEMDSKVEKDDRDNQSLIATLVFMVTFATAFTVPEGVRSDNGVPVRLHAAALKCFILSDTLAFCFSIIAMFILTFKRNVRVKFTVRIYCLLLIVQHYRGFVYFGVRGYVLFFPGLGFVTNAINATVVAFITGVYVTLAPKNSWLALAVCTMGVLTFFIYFPMLHKVRYEPAIKVVLRSELHIDRPSNIYFVFYKGL